MLPADNSVKCPLYDQVKDRKDKQIGAAEQQAKERIRKENPDISEEDLEIRFSNDVKKSRFGQARDHFFPGDIAGLVPAPPHRHRMDAARYQVPRYQAPGHQAPPKGLVQPLGPVADHPVLQAQPLQNDPLRHGLDIWQRMFPGQRPENLGARPAPPNEPPYRRLDNNLHDLNLWQLEQEAPVRRLQMHEHHQAHLARLQEQEAQVARQLRTQADALRDARLEPLRQPQVRVPFRHPQEDPFLQRIGRPLQPANVFPGLPLRVSNAPQMNQQPNTDPNPNQGIDVSGARRRRHRHHNTLD